MRGVLVLIQAWDPVASARVEVRLGAAKNAATLGAGGQIWEPAMQRLPRLSMQLVDDDITGLLMTGRGDMVVAVDQIRELPNARSLEFTGAPIRVLSGNGIDLDDFRVEMRGRVTSGPVNPQTWLAELQMEVDRGIFDVPLLTREYSGDDAADGMPEIRGTLKPAGFGRPINFAPVLINQELSVFQVDGYGNTVSIDAVFEDLGDFGSAIADYPTYAALVAATIPEGRWATCVAAGMFRLGAEPVGRITCDATFGGGRAGSMMLRWLRTHVGVQDALIRASDFDDLTEAVRAKAGRQVPMSYWTTDGGNVLDLMQRMCGSVNAMPLLMLDGTIGVSRVLGGGEQIVLNRQGGDPLVTDWATGDQTTPWWRLRMTAARSFYVNSPSEIRFDVDLTDADRGDWRADIAYKQGSIVRYAEDGRRWFRVVEADSTAGQPPSLGNGWEVWEEAPDATTVRYADGTPVEDKKPAEKGSDVTGNNTSKDTGAVGGRPATEVIDRLDDTKVRLDNQIFRIDDILIDIDELYGMVGQDQADLAEAVRQARAARDEAITKAQDADGYALVAKGYRDDAAGSVTASQGWAVTAGRNATIAEGHAATATRDANAAVSARDLAVTYRDAAGQALAASFPRTAKPAAFTVSPGAFVAPPIPEQPGVSGRIVMDTRIPMPPYPFGLWTAATLPFVPGTVIRLRTRLEWVDGSPDQPAGIFYAHYYNASGQVVFENTIGGSFSYPANVPTSFSTEFTMGLNDGSANSPAFVRYGVLVNRKPENNGNPTVGRTDIHMLYPEDITSAAAAANSARISGEQRVLADAASSSAAESNRLSAFHAGQAAGSAQGAAGSAGTASTEAQASRDARVLATAQASLSLQYARVSASAGIDSLLDNPQFVVWPDGQMLPTGWIRWLNDSSAYKIVGSDGRNAIAFDQGLNVNNGFLAQYDANPVLKSLRPNVWYMVEIDIALRLGSRFTGLGFYLQGRDASEIEVESVRYPLAQGMSGGLPVPNPVQTNKFYQFRVPVRMSHSAITSGALYFMSYPDLFGYDNAEGKHPSIRRLNVRQMNEAEIAGRRVPDLEATVNITQAAQIDKLLGRARGFFEITANAASELAFFQLSAEVTPGSVTSNVSFGAREFHVYSPAEGGWKKALSIVGGNVLLNGGLQAGAFIRLGNGVGWPVALQTRAFPVSDGSNVNFGTDVGGLPRIVFLTDGLAPLNSGETYVLRATNLTSTGFIASLRISVPGTLANEQVGASEFSSAKPTARGYRGSRGQAARGDYRFVVDFSGTVRNYQVGEPGQYTLVASFWVLKGGVWQAFTTYAVTFYGDFGGATTPGNERVDQTYQLGDNVEGFGVALDSTDGLGSNPQVSLAQVYWQSQASSSSSRSATPNGEQSIAQVSPQ